MDFNKLRDIIAEQFGVSEDSITLETTFEELGADSLDLVELIMNLEEELDVKIEDEDIENLKSIGEILEYIKEKQE